MSDGRIKRNDRTAALTAEQLRARYELDKLKDIDGKLSTAGGTVTGNLSVSGDLSLSSALPVPSGGSGKSTFTSGSYLVGNGANAVAEKTPAEVLFDIGAASKPVLLWSNASPSSDFQAQNISMDLTPYAAVMVVSDRSNAIGTVGSGVVTLTDFECGGDVVPVFNTRSFQATANGVYFYVGLRFATMNSVTAAAITSAWCKPLKIYGLWEV